MFAFWFSSSFVKGNRLVLKKEELDKAHKDTSHKSYHANFRVELVFNDMSASPDQAQAQNVAAAITSDATGDSSSSTSPPQTSEQNGNHEKGPATEQYPSSVK